MQKKLDKLNKRISFIKLSQRAQHHDIQAALEIVASILADLSTQTNPEKKNTKNLDQIMADIAGRKNDNKD